MSNITLNALVRFPTTAYFLFNKAMDGKATIENINHDRESNDYVATITFPIEEMEACSEAIISCAGLITKLGREITPTSVQKYIGTGKAKLVAKYAKEMKNGRWIATKQKLPVTKSRRRKSTGTKTERATELSKLVTALSGGWKNANQLQTETASKNSSMYARFSKLKKDGVLQSKTGPDGKMLYRIAAAAA